MPKGVYLRTADMQTGRYLRTDAVKAQCRINASKAGGFHGTHSHETREKMRQAKLARPTNFWLGKKRGATSPETRSKQRDAKRRSGFMPSAAARKKGAIALHGGPTSIERAMAAALARADISFFAQFEIGRYIADFLLPSLNLVIECDGKLWHGAGKFAKPDKEAKRDAFIAAQGVEILRVPEDLIRDGGRLSTLVNQLQKGHGDVSTGVQNL